ncbi:hypothetical protein COW46_00880 [Candidatus Gracilibacteria bacterium CG17_big_fil_post_rev_8_21_14_2_50_48_13]|nr:MAG: hypothetical protein COW46_00880 [Candidatus Gracilibacteria bacterium CG17_big_fil_post_rev_8_21_14_2_50_48_13]
MLLRSRLKIKNNVRAVLKDADGNIVPVFQPNAFGLAFFKATGKLPQLPVFGAMSTTLSLSNLVTTAGRAALAAKIGGVSVVGDWKYLAIGTDNTAATIGDIALGAEITTGGGARAVATAALTTTDTTNDTLQLDYEWTFSSTFAVNEVGVFNAASGPTMLARVLFPAGVINVSSGMKLHVYWKLDLD